MLGLSDWRHEIGALSTPLSAKSSTSQESAAGRAPSKSRPGSWMRGKKEEFVVIGLGHFVNLILDKRETKMYHSGRPDSQEPLEFQDPAGARIYPPSTSTRSSGNFVGHFAAYPYMGGVEVVEPVTSAYQHSLFDDAATQVLQPDGNWTRYWYNEHAGPNPIPFDLVCIELPHEYALTLFFDVFGIDPTEKVLVDGKYLPMFTYAMYDSLTEIAEFYTTQPSMVALQEEFDNRVKVYDAETIYEFDDTRDSEIM